MGNMFHKQTVEEQQAADTAARAYVAQAIATHKVVMFSKIYCPYCVKAKMALNSLLQPGQYTSIEINGRPDCSAIQDVLFGMTGARTVPRVFVGGVCIGGGDETAHKAKAGELKKLLTINGVL